MCTVAVHESTVCGEQPDLRAARNTVRAEKKETKAQLSRARKPRRGAKWGMAPLNFRLNSVRLYDWLGAARNAAANKCSPELGSAVSRVVENLSRKIHMETTKSYAYGVLNVYLLWWVSHTDALYGRSRGSIQVRV